MEDNPENKLIVRKRLSTEPSKGLKKNIDTISKEDFASFIEQTRRKLCLPQNSLSTSS